MIKKIGICLLSILSLFSLYFYSIKFYCDKRLEFNDQPTLLWVLILGLITMSLIVGIYNTYANYKLGIEQQKSKEREEELIRLVVYYGERCENDASNVLESIYNSRDISLDTYNMIKKEKGNV